MSQIQCHTCHASIDADDRFCSSCGAKLVKASNGKGAAENAASSIAAWQQVVEVREHAYVCRIPQGWRAQLVLSRDHAGIGYFDFMATDATGSTKLESPSKTIY